MSRDTINYCREEIRGFILAYLSVANISLGLFRSLLQNVSVISSQVSFHVNAQACHAKEESSRPRRGLSIEVYSAQEGRTLRPS